MSRAIAFVKFRKTGNIYCGCYDGTVDLMYDCFCAWYPYIDIFDYCSKHVIKAIPESIADCWLLLVKDWNENLEEYEDEICLHPHEPYWKNLGIDIIE